jgi:catechol 2,3-dioxygenase-like lactoylglutathione lyase family enzyme
VLTNVMYVSVYVTDQDQALEFYTQKLGLEKRVDYSGSEGRFLTVGVPGNSLEIILWPGTPGQGQAIDTTQPGTVPGPVVIESDDVRKEFEALRARDVTFEEPGPADYAFGVRVTALDPDGNRISLRQPRKRGGR